MSGFDWSCNIYKNGELQPYEDRLGTGAVQLAVHKCYPELFVNNVQVDEQEFRRRYASKTDDVGDIIWVDNWETAYHGEINGYRFRAQHFDGNMIDLELIEPDGTTWTARAGYCFGVRFGIDSEGNSAYGAIPWEKRSEP